MPVNGKVHIYRTEEKVVVEPPNDSEYKGFEIVIENIDAYAEYDNKAVKAGTKIGKATKARACVSNWYNDKVRMHNLNYI